MLRSINVQWKCMEMLSLLFKLNNLTGTVYTMHVPVTCIILA